MKRSPAVILSAALALAACAAPAYAPPGPVPAGAVGSAPLSRAAAAATITAEDMEARIAFLASDAMRGRDTPSRELEIAAEYLVLQYRMIGALPAGEDGGYWQRWPFPLRRLHVDAAALEFHGGGLTLRPELGRDFFSAGGTTATLSNLGMVWAGHGSDATLAPGTLRDRVAIVALPGAMTRDWRLERTRQLNAAQRSGAAAIVYVLDPAWDADSIARHGASSRAATRTMGGGVGHPQLLLTYASARAIFAAAGLSLDDLWRESAAAGQPVSLPGVTASIGLPLESLDRATAPNVLAMIPGSDPALRDEYVVLSAHLDHVGVGQQVNGDSIYNGADDNASGTAALLEVAEAFARLGVRPRRTVVFLHVSGEEKGLLGSRWYSEHPTLPLERTVANINVDMIGRNSPDSVVVIGKTYSSLGALADRVGAAHPELGLTLSDDLWPDQRFFFRSDHFNFARKEIPALFFFTGVHECYHRPCDRVEEIDADKAARIARMIFHLVHEIADAPGRPEWDPAGLEEVRRMTR
jgi:Zn-dependent M28 family amino/carboxypeptidase